MRNTNLHNAKRAKNDEFYTQLTDIEKELKYYKDQLKNNVINNRSSFINIITE